MNKSEIKQLNDTELFARFHQHTIRLVHEANSRGGETKKTTKEFGWIVDECVSRFGLDEGILIKEDVIVKQSES